MYNPHADGNSGLGSSLEIGTCTALPLRVTNAILRVGHAVQSTDVSIAGQSFTDLTGATLTFTLQRSMKVAMHGHGSVTGSGGTATYTHCGFRFVIDGAGQGDGTWGDEIIGVGRTGHPGWFSSWSIGREVTLVAGTHSIKLQMTGWSGSDAACLNVANSYGAAQLWLEGY
ncbi:MAG: hypothetical protein NTY08_01245 [Proteobacteria bacterium]|nr:hypothetical protein [Pseudomonadota bacterium]